jgi:hypothetical protein
MGLLAGMAAGFLTADATYTQTTKFTGGSLIEMTKKMASMPLLGKMGGGGLKQAFDDQHYDIYVKGNKEARIGTMLSTIFDLDAGTVTTVDNTKRTYSVQTFDEMREQMERMQQRMNRGQNGDLQFDVKAEKTGQTRTIDGETANETLVTMTAKQANASGQMVIKMDLWLVPVKSSMQEIVDFQRRLAEKFAYALGSFSPMMGAAGSGMSAALKESFKQDGYPALTEMTMSGVSSPGGPMAMMGGGGNGDPNAPLMQMETATGSFATGSVDDAKFSVPAGYKEEKRRH